MIRDAILADIPRLLELGEVMFSESFYSAFTYDPLKTQYFLQAVITEPKGVLFVYEKDGQIVGGMVGWVEEMWFGPETVLSDFALFVEPGTRGQMVGAALIKKFIEHGKEIGAAQTTLSNSTGVDRDRVGELYKRLGMQLIGYCYTQNNKE